MPHLVIESSENIESEIIESIHLEVASQETVNIESLKTRFILCQAAFEANFSESNSNHVAITLKLLEGRSDELKRTMANNILSKAKSLIRDRQLSVEVIDLGIYTK